MGRTGLILPMAGLILAVIAASSAATGQTAPVAPPQPVAAGEPKVTATEVERKGRTGFDILLGTYLTLDRDCKIGQPPVLSQPTEPKGGKLRTRPGPINLRDVPGAPRRNCIGVSPNGLAIVYRAERRFRGEDLAVFRLTYPNGDIREVTAKIIVQ